MRVHIVAGTNELNYEKAHLLLCKDVTVVTHFHERSTGAKFEGCVGRHMQVRCAGHPCGLCTWDGSDG